MKNSGKSVNIQKMAITAVLTALIILMTFTGIAYIPIGPLKLTLNVLPVAIGAVMLGTGPGLFLGFIFGLSSFITCFGMDAFGAVLLGINPVGTFITCIVPRLLCGVLPALIYKAISKNEKYDFLATSIGCISTPIINTLLFMFSLWLFFGRDIASNPDIIAMMGGAVLDSFIAILVAMSGVNAILEAISVLILGTAIVKTGKIVLKKAK